MKRPRLFWIIFAVAAFSAAACAALVTLGVVFFVRGRSEPIQAIAPGVPLASVLDLSHARERFFELDVAERTVALRVDLHSRGTELHLDARRGAGTYADEEADFGITTDSGEASISLGRFTDPPLEPGAWTLRVAWASELLPRTVDVRLHEVPFRIEVTSCTARVDGILEPGRALASSVDEKSGGFRTFQVDVPQGSRALRIDLIDVSSDLDLYLRHGGPVLALDDDVLFAQHMYGRESLVVGEDGEAVESGPWFVDVVDVRQSAGPIAFRALASLRTEPPAEILAIPRLPKADEHTRAGSPAAAPVERALAAVVEIATDDGLGSGTILTEDGWILTNAHVVAGLGGGSVEDVVISASLDPREPPVELFRGHVERVDEDRDLALVHVSSGFYGQPLPQGYTFPTVDVGDSDAIGIGDPIWLVGYPSTGGQGSRVTITCTRGVLSGWDRAAFGPVLKTDAEITSGSSGGAAVDAQGRIVGVPTSIVELGSGQVGYLHPVSALPEEWRPLLFERRGR